MQVSTLSFYRTLWAQESLQNPQTACEPNFRATVPRISSTLNIGLLARGLASGTCGWYLVIPGAACRLGFGARSTPASWTCSYQWPRSQLPWRAVIGCSGA